MLGHRVCTTNDHVVCMVYVIILNTWHCTFTWHSLINQWHNLIFIHDLELRSANEHPFSCNQRISKRKQSGDIFFQTPHVTGKETKVEKRREVSNAGGTRAKVLPSTAVLFLPYFVIFH